jgi:hypothetical protein
LKQWQSTAQPLPAAAAPWHSTAHPWLCNWQCCNWQLAQQGESAASGAAAAAEHDKSVFVAQLRRLLHG